MKLEPIEIIVIGVVIAGLMSFLWMLGYWPFTR
jgi:hypothetical protein